MYSINIVLHTKLQTQKLSRFHINNSHAHAKNKSTCNRTLFDQPDNVHQVWDTELVMKALKENYNSDPEVMADSILNNITVSKQTHIEHCTII